MEQVGSELRDAREDRIVHHARAELVLQMLDALLHDLLNGKVIFDQVIPELVHEKARAAGKSQEVGAVVAAYGAQERDRPFVNREKELFRNHDVDALEVELAAPLAAARDDEV